MLVIEADQGDNTRLGHVLGNYRLIRKLGEGGVGSVYEAEHVYTERRVALITPDRALALDTPGEVTLHMHYVFANGERVNPCTPS